MKRINASFYSKDYKHKFAMEATVRRAFRDHTGHLVQDGASTIKFLDENEMARDTLTIKVFGKSRNDIVAVAKAYVAQVYPQNVGLLNEAVFDSVREVGTAFASMQLNRQRLAISRYDKAVASVLIIESIEVAPEYRRNRIATSIVDYLLHTIRTEYVTAVVPLSYVPCVSKNVTVPAMADTKTAERFLESLQFKHDDNVKIKNAGMAMPMRFYHIIKE